MLRHRSYHTYFDTTKRLLLVLLLGLSLPVLSKKTIPLNPNISNEVLIDSSSFEAFDSIPGQRAIPLNLQKWIFYNPIPEQPVWFRTVVHNPTDSVVDWLLISHFYSVDQIDIYITRSNGTTEHQLFRDTMNLYDRVVTHKHPTFRIHFEKHERVQIIFKIKNESSYEYPMVFMTRESFESKFFGEYIIYGLFYGFLLFVLISCFINLLFFRDVVVMFYIFFILSQIIYMLFRDGIGLYLIPFAPEYSDLAHGISRTAVTVSLLLYTWVFLRIRKKSKTFKMLMAIVAFRILFGLIEFKDTSIITFHIEFLIIATCTMLTFRHYRSANAEVRYMSMGLSFLCLIYIFDYISIIGWIPYTAFSFWSLYIGIAGENIFFMLALTERFKRTRVERYRQEKMNRELEHMVEQRTETVQLQNRLLESQSKELNLFLYSASHDLKGPLKTIEGLCNVGMMDNSADHNLIFGMIKTKLQKLESNINDLNAVTKLKYSNNVNHALEMKTLHQDILDRFEKYPGMESMNIATDIQYEDPVFIDLFTIRSIYQNIVENAIKYRDRTKQSRLLIRILKTDNTLVLRFEDNGQGIESDKISRIFEMFYRGNEESREDTGLGLYIVKLAVEKLGGSITVDSTLGEGTTFEIRIPV